ncbi:hypothetical protein AB4151_19860 [Vibrio splendidus]|uniref:Uncharacterized protein n=1 Tax=Vibrio splendidus TaxID=29497 RepID=A0A2N7C7Q9_VIBSP|nr:hypothetical protein [Vibrio splendidus]PMF16870.1 hypothetical protein BCV19_19980 [Vibrio splendidus]
MGNRKETHSALNLANFNLEQAGRAFNVEVERTIRELNGEPCKVWDECRADNQQIFSTRSVGQRITTLEELKQALTFHVATVASLTNDTTKITAAVSEMTERLCRFGVLYYKIGLWGLCLILNVRLTCSLNPIIPH